jgi:ATP-dependent Zn protease
VGSRRVVVFNTRQSRRRRLPFQKLFCLSKICLGFFPFLFFLDTFFLERRHDTNEKGHTKRHTRQKAKAKEEEEERV